MATTVTGPIGATYDAVFDGISATLTRVGGVVGYAETGGAIAPDQKTYVTSGGGVLTMEDLKPGRYTLSLSVPISESTTQTKLWEAAGVVQVDAGDNITLDAFLTDNVEPLTPSLVQQAIAARDAAVAAAGEAEGFRNEAEGFRDQSASSAAEANTSATQAELAALAAGAPIVTSLTDPVPASGTVELLKLDAGLQVHEVVTGAWVLRGWLVGPNFDTVQALLDDASTSLGATGQIVHAGGFRYEVVTTGEHVTTAGGVHLVVLPLAGGGVDVRAFGAIGDDVADDRPAFLQAFIAGGRNGHKIKVPKGSYFFSEPLILNNETLGFDWRNLYMEMEATASPFQNIPFADWMPVKIRVDGTSAIVIHLEAFGHERIDFQNFTAANTAGTDRAGLRAIDIVVDGARNYNYPVGWFFDKVSCNNFEALFRFRGINMPAQNNRFVGLINIDNLHAWQTDYSIDVDGLYLNFFRGKNWRCHGRGKIRLNAQSGGHFFIGGLHHESARPSRFEIHTNALNSFFSLHDMDGETNGDNTVITSEPYPDGFVTVLGSGQLLNQHDFTFTGFVRLPSFGELPPTVPAGIALSNYTQAPIRVIPKGCTIRTPDTVRIVAPPADGNSLSRHFRFFVPLDRIKGRSGERFVAWPTTGRRATGSAQPRFRRAQQFPGVEAVAAITNNNTFAGQQTGPIFSCAHVMDVVRNSTRPWGNPIPITINGSASNHFLSAELANGPHLCVYGLSLGEDTLNVFAPPEPTNPGANWIVSPGLLSFGEDNLMASDYFFPQGYAQTFEQECPAEDQIDIRVSGTNSADITDGLSGTIKVTLDDGLSGAGEWRFTVTSAERVVTEVFNAPITGITLSAPVVSNFDIINVRVASDLLVPVKARALIRFD